MHYALRFPEGAASVIEICRF